MNEGHFTGVIYVEVFQVDKDNQKIVTRTNNEGWKMGAETISLCSGEHYIILPQCNGEIQSVISQNKWTAKNGNIYEPHGCLPKGKQNHELFDTNYVNVIFFRKAMPKM